MSMDQGLNMYLNGRAQRAKSEANQIIADARRVAYRMVQEAGVEEQRTIDDLNEVINELKAERTRLRKTLSRYRAELKRLTDSMRERAENDANKYGAGLKLRARKQAEKIVAKARKDAKEIREDAERARAQAELDGARMAGMTVEELDEGRKREGWERLLRATAEAYPNDFVGRLAA